MSVERVDLLVGEKFASLESQLASNIHAELDRKLDNFGNNILDLINEKLGELVPNPSFPAPQEDPGVLSPLRKENPVRHRIPSHTP